MQRTRTDLLHRQFDLIWALFDHHLERLGDDDLLWEPVRLCRTVRRSEDGTWLPDWAEPEPDPVPVPTIAWVTWHIGWWWSVTTDHLRGRQPRERAEVVWPGDAASTVSWMRELHDGWKAVLDGLTDDDLAAGATFPWEEGADMAVGDTLTWVNTELTKNVAELGLLRLLRAAG
ncbi:MULTISPECIES: DinB family protein [unclassified Pseudonocardia]|uniref:DinB family protein n=1 Tax=unclassified Pseudonocardia TaxID=2619320 RepID=UPI001CF69FBF|nr:DinB family protein [Pseudonocardia sp. ICBG601]